MATDTKKLDLTLSRWHKVIERLKELAQKAATDARMGLNDSSVADLLGQHQIAHLKIKGEEGKAGLKKHGEYLNVIRMIRDVLAKENAGLGISNILGEIEMNRLRVDLVKEILDAQHPGRVAPDEVEGIFARLNNKADVNVRTTVNAYGLVLDNQGNNGIHIRQLESEDLKELKKEIAELRTASYKLSDKLADLNARKIKLELPAEIAQELGY